MRKGKEKAAETLPEPDELTRALGKAALQQFEAKLVHLGVSADKALLYSQKENQINMIHLAADLGDSDKYPDQEPRSVRRLSNLKKIINDAIKSVEEDHIAKQPSGFLLLKEKLRKFYPESRLVKLLENIIKTYFQEESAIVPSASSSLQRGPAPDPSDSNPSP